MSAIVSKVSPKDAMTTPAIDYALKPGVENIARNNTGQHIRIWKIDCVKYINRYDST